MIADLKPYVPMKDSGAPWLGEVPAHWEVRRGKWLFRHRKQINADRASSNVLSLTLRGVVNNDPENPEGLVPKDYATYQLFRKGDLVFKLIDLENLRTSRVGLVHEDGIMSSAYVRLIPQSVAEIRFFFLQYFDLYQRGIYNQLGAGVRSTLSPHDLLDLNVVVPSAPEQAAIVGFLDHVDRQIRRYIRTKQTLIKLLEEQKQAIIQRAVTRGLDRNVDFKPLGSAPGFEVNARWRVARLWDISRIRSEKKRADLDLLSVFLGRGVIPYGEGSGQVHKPSLDLAGYQVVYPGDLVLNNQQAWRGSVGVSKYRGIISPAYVVLKLANAFDSRFADLLFQSRVMVSQFVTASKGVGDIQRDIHMPWLKNARVPIPPIEVQRAIAIALDRELDDAARQLSLFDQEVSLLRELRTRLIADVVTGKLDVREAAARLPLEAEEAEPLDEADALADAEEDTADDLDAVPEEAEA